MCRRETVTGLTNFQVWMDNTIFARHPLAAAPNPASGTGTGDSMKKLLVGAGGVSLVIAAVIAVQALNVKSQKDEYGFQRAMSLGDCVINRGTPKGDESCAMAARYERLELLADQEASAAKSEKLTVALVVAIIGVGLAVLSLHGRKPKSS